MEQGQDGKLTSTSLSQIARPTMRDVAALAGVSLKTVSRVVNDHPRVHPDLASRVRQAAAQLSYQPNLTASNLRRSGGRSATIGLLLEDVANPFSASIYRAVEDVAVAHGVAVLAGSLDEEPERERELVAALIARRVDGLIIVPAGHDQSYLQHEQRTGTALVFVDRPPMLLGADSVLADNRAGAATGVRHLIEHGHRRIAYLGDSRSIVTAKERFTGYAEALAESGIPVDPAMIRQDLRTIELAKSAAAELLSSRRPPTAIFAGQNLVTIGAIRELRERGLQHTTALIGFDDLLLADLLEPAITVVAQDPAAMGTLAAEILFTRVAGDASPAREHVVPTRLIQRGSGEIGPPTRGR